MRRVYFNGKFYTAGLNGVHRVADRLINEVDRLLGALPPEKRPETTILLPNADNWAPKLRHIGISRDPRWTGQSWEQLVLPVRAADGVLVNLCNLAPVLHRRKLLMIHDAQFLFPDSSYPARQRWGYKVLTPLMARTSLHVWTVSDYSRQMLDLLGVSRRQRTSVVYNGIDHLGDITPSAPAEMPSGPFVVMFASPKGYKNCEVVFSAFRDARLKDVRLALVGPGREDLAKAGLSAPEDAHFLGKLKDEELRFVLSKALCLLCPSRTEGFGLPPLKAMLNGCPAVVAPAGAMPEICGDVAAYAGVDDPGEWVAAILRYANEAEWRAAKVSAGLSRAASFTWARAGAQLFEGIQTAANR